MVISISHPSHPHRMDISGHSASRISKASLLSLEVMSEDLQVEMEITKRPKFSVLTKNNGLLVMTILSFQRCKFNY